MRRLARDRHSEYKLTDQGLERISHLSDLGWLRMAGHFSDTGLLHLSRLQSLGDLWLTTDQPVTELAADSLDQALPLLDTLEIKVVRTKTQQRGK